MMERLLVVLAVALGAAVGTALPASASWSSAHCNSHPGQVSYLLTRDVAMAYALDAKGDGYEWGGGCWNRNGVDDTPGAPDSGGEGPDCSGFTFKTWQMKTDFSDDWWRWSWITGVHGPYTASSFKSGVGAAMVIGKGYGTTRKMDAFASSTHIGMLYSELANGQDRIIEAKGDAQGTGIWTRSYRSNASYGGVRRQNWG